jgi:hypothetical protein
MADLKHTPGPWNTMAADIYRATYRIFAGSEYLASVGNSVHTREQTAANARLIAAAPELLAELEEAQSHLAVLVVLLEDDDDSRARWADTLAGARQTLAECRAVIDQAKGGSGHV